MATIKNIKGQLVNKLNGDLDKRIIESQNALEAARDSRDSETKSSMGDKYETGREMVQMEMSKYEDQLTKALKLKKALAAIKINKEHTIVEFGTIVNTNQGIYFISVGLGVVKFEGTTYFAISLASPVGKLLEGKSVGNKIVFQGREIEILDIV